jgi:Flp pilus assembly protein TadG
MKAAHRDVLRLLATDRRGAAAVEFGIIAPVLAVVLAGVIQYGGMLFAYDRMHDAVSAGAVYVMRAGRDTSAVHDITVNAWSTPPSDATVTVSQTCTCAGVSASCTNICADNSYPIKSTIIDASGTYVGIWSTQTMQASQTVRTQ